MPTGTMPLVVPAYPAGGKQASPLGFIGALALLTLVGGGAGSLLAPRLLAPVSAAAADARTTGAIPPPSKYGSGAGIEELPPIVTNLASPPDAWIRLQLAMLYDTKSTSDPDAIAGQITEDVIAYLRTVSVPQLEGAAGLEYLHEDLNERAAIRSNSSVKELMIELLVVQ